MVDKCIVEVKCGVREFSPQDIKQVLIYATLNSVSDVYPELSQFELYNPRVGLIHKNDFNSLCLDIAGCSDSEIYTEIAKCVTDTLMSI
ncbi:MAG: hypothetical protein MUO27_09915 [Sedimentisphaerales bacterium]|nr:hypothetical protein [Sedimentisphaerales bacterium]